MNRLKIVVTNDDGIDSEGLRALVEVLALRHDVRCFAPSSNCSGVGTGVRYRGKIGLARRAADAVAVDGMPVDAARAGIAMAFDGPPDILVAGVNRGPNLGLSLPYSGTLAAAYEGVGLRLPPLAVSLVEAGGGHFRVAAQIAQMVVERLAAALTSASPARQGSAPSPADGVVININVPDRPLGELTGAVVTRPGEHYGYSRVKPAPDGATFEYEAVEAAFLADLEGTDAHAVRVGQVSITPLSRYGRDQGVGTLADALRRITLAGIG